MIAGLEPRLPDRDLCLPVPHHRDESRALRQRQLLDSFAGTRRALVDLGVPRDATVVAVLRAERLIVPRGDTVLRVGDEVVVLVTDESEEDVRALLVAPR